MSLSRHAQTCVQACVHVYSHVRWHAQQTFIDAVPPAELAVVARHLTAPVHRHTDVAYGMCADMDADMCAEMSADALLLGYGFIHTYTGLCAFL